MNHRKILSQFLLFMKNTLSENKVTLMRNTPDPSIQVIDTIHQLQKAREYFLKQANKILTHIITRNRLLREEVI